MKKCSIWEWETAWRVRRLVSEEKGEERGEDAY
jgi:hypothetical protein